MLLNVCILLLLVPALAIKKVMDGSNLAGMNFSMVLVGGGLDDNNKEIWNKIVELGGGRGVARFGVMAAAGEDPCCDVQSSFFLYDTLLKLYGAAEVYYIPVTKDSKDQNSNADVVAQIKTLTGFFFTGGDQIRIIYSLYNSDEKIPSPVLLAIRETLLATGGVVAGTSAGTDCLTSYTMITGGASYNGLVNGTKLFWRTAEYSDEDIMTAYGPGGVGLFPYGLVDTHFANRGRQGRMIRLMTDSRTLPTGSLRAFGVDENTALVVTGPWLQRSASVIGERGVLMLDATDAEQPLSTSSYNNNNNIVPALVKLRATRLSVGDSLDLSSWQLTPASFKVAMAGRETPLPPATSQDVFAEGSFEFDSLTRSLLLSTSQSTQGVSKETSPQAVLTVSKAPASGAANTAQGFDGINPTTGLYAYTYSELWVSVYMK
mmetsp:Transcript_31908/g.45932  ORF Transcript_31908/g.45932 Transcript_31908/m.45932 type:complete len:432 (-) Transcript_31908:363-1658(-)